MRISIAAGSNSILSLSLIITAVLWLLPISSHATVDWNEEFEYVNDTAFGAVWEHSCLGNPSISTALPHNGSKSVREVFRGTVGITPGAGGCYMDRLLPTRSETQYTRFWIYFQNMQLNDVGTKITLQGDPSFYPSFWWIMNAGDAPVAGQPGFLDVHVQGIVLDSGALDTRITHGGVAIPQNQWVCVELRTTMSSPGVDNGIIQQWINGNLSINATNVRMRGATLNQQNSPTAQMLLSRLYVQHGWGTIYFDDYAVSRDARIGCGSSSSVPRGDTTPPASPNRLTIR